MSGRIRDNLVMIGFFIFVVCLMFHTGGGSAETLTVDDDGGADFFRIQDAIDHSTEGDTIRVFEGTYHERILINHSITIVGNGTVSTSFVGDGGWDVVTINAPGVHLSNVLIRTEFSDPRYNGTVINADHVSIINTTITNTLHGIHSSANHTTIEHCVFTSNAGSGISLLYSNGSTILNTTCSTNDGYGIYARRSGNCTIFNTTCSMNKASGITFERSEFCTILESECSSNQRSGLYLDHSENATVVGNDCNDNVRNGIRLGLAGTTTLMRNMCSLNHHAGISVSSSDHIFIKNNTCTSNRRDGIYISSSEQGTVTNNTMLSNDECGLSIRRLYHSSFWNNTCSSSQGSHGIEVFDSDHASFRYNSLFGNAVYGIFLWGSSNCTFEENDMGRGSIHGIVMSRSVSCTFETNTMIDGGFIITGNLEEWSTHSIPESNTIDGVPLHYFANRENMDFSGVSGQLILANCTDSMITGVNVSGGSIGIQVGYCSRVILSNISCEGTREGGIILTGSDNCTIEDSTCSGNIKDGILIVSSENCSIRRNDCASNFHYGIHVEDSRDCTLEANLVESNGKDGIYLRTSKHCVLRSNIARSNGQNGIHLSQVTWCTLIDSHSMDNWDYGIELALGKDCSIRNGSTIGNTRSGIWIDRSSRTVVSGSTCESNGNSGIRLSTVENTSVLSTICELNDEGISLVDAEYSNLNGNEISQNHVGISVSHDVLKTMIHRNSIEGNDAGITNFWSEEPVNAKRNWWGHDSGPFHDGSNPGGQGNSVSSGVLFDPWLNSQGVHVSLPDDGDGEGRDTTEHMILILLLTVLTGLFTTLVHVVRSSHWHPGRGKGMEARIRTAIGYQELSSADSPASRKMTESPQASIQCQFCGGSFQVAGRDMGIRVTCPLCGEETVMNRSEAPGEGFSIDGE